MSWRFRQSFKIIPGVRLNLSKSGLSASIGGAPFTVNVGPRGVFGTAPYREQVFPFETKYRTSLGYGPSNARAGPISFLLGNMEFNASAQTGSIVVHLAPKC